MTTAGLSFAAQVDDWVKATEQRMTAVFRESTQRVVEQAQARIPIDTGFARASVQVSLEAMPPIMPSNKGVKGAAYPYEGAVIALTLADAEIGDTIYVGWTAAYALALEYGHSKQAPAGFVRLAAQNWQQIVAQVAEEAKGRVAFN